MTEHPDDGSWQIQDDEVKDSEKTENPDEISAPANGVNDTTNKTSTPRSSGNHSLQSIGTASSKSTKSSTRRKIKKLRLEIECLRKQSSASSSSRSRNQKSWNGSRKSREPPQAHDNHGDDDSLDSSLTSSTRSSTRREIERLRSENEQIRSELAELKRNFEALSQSADREEALWFLVLQLANLVQKLQTEIGEIDTNSGVTTTIVAPSFWKKYQKEGIFLILVTGAVVTRHCMPVSIRDRLRMAAMVEIGVKIAQVASISKVFMENVPDGVRMAQVPFENGVAYVSEIFMENVPNGMRIAQEAIENSVAYPAGETIAQSIEEAITGMLNISQNGVGLAELD